MLQDGWFGGIFSGGENESCRQSKDRAGALAEHDGRAALDSALCTVLLQVLNGSLEDPGMAAAAAGSDATADGKAKANSVPEADALKQLNRGVLAPVFEGALRDMPPAPSGEPGR